MATGNGWSMDSLNPCQVLVTFNVQFSGKGASKIPISVGPRNQYHDQLYHKLANHNKMWTIKAV